MGMTYWIHTREGDTVSADSDDHTMMHRLSDELDEACRSLGVPELSSFEDFTDIELNMMDEPGDEDWGDEDFDDGGQVRGMMDEMEWFDPAAGLQCMEALREHVVQGWNEMLDDDEREMLLEELEDCINTLKALPAGVGKFNLAVVM